MKRYALLTAGLLTMVLAGCGDDSSGPNQPPPPDLSSPRAALRSLAEIYSRQQFPEAMAAHSASFRFVPAQPESIPFLEPGETFWDMDREELILERLLVPERISWIDQVLLEPVVEEVVDSTSTLTRISTRTDFKFLVGSQVFASSRSYVDYLYELNADGNWLVREQRERLFPGSEVTFGQLKSRVEAAPIVETLEVDEATISSTGATLKGRVDPRGLSTTYWFEWGTTTAYGSQSAPADAGADFVLTTHELPVIGLMPSTEYHFRIVARSLWGTSRGADRTFTTGS